MLSPGIGWEGQTSAECETLREGRSATYYGEQAVAASALPLAYMSDPYATTDTCSSPAVPTSARLTPLTAGRKRHACSEYLEHRRAGKPGRPLHQSRCRCDHRNKSLITFRCHLAKRFTALADRPMPTLDHKKEDIVGGKLKSAGRRMQRVGNNGFGLKGRVPKSVQADSKTSFCG